MSQHQECVNNPQPGQANPRYVCAPKGTFLLDWVAKPSEYRMESQPEGKVSFALKLVHPQTQESILKLSARFSDTALASPWKNCLGPNEVKGFVEYPQSSLQSATKYEIFAMHFRHMDLTGVKQGEFAMTVQVHLRQEDDPSNIRTLRFKRIHPTIPLMPSAPEGPSDSQNDR